MIDIGEITQRLVMHEGLRLQPYRCTRGYLTIGVGRNLDSNPPTAEEQRVIGDWRSGITKNAAFFLLRNDIKRVVNECKKAFPFFKELDDERQYALIDMTFQMGVNRVKGFQKMLAALACGNYETAAAECLASNYARQTPARAERIAKTIKTGRFEI